jgi:hypothetical protein
MAALLTAVNELIDAIHGQRAWVEELNDISQRIAQHLHKANRAEANEALRRLVGLFPDVPLVALGQVATSCGSLVEIGGDPGIAGPALLDKLPRVNEMATDFYALCRAHAEADEGLIEELRSLSEASDDGDEPNQERAPTDWVAEHVANEGWSSLASRYGPVLYQDHPTSVLGHMADQFFRLALIAHLARSKPLRAAARARPELLQQTQSADAAAEQPSSFLSTMLRVLDDEALTVLHPEQRRGYEVRISGIADNFQLHTLLGGALIGKPKDGWLTGEKPSKRAVAEFRDADIGAKGGAEITGPFNLLNWTGLRPDGSLSGGHAPDEVDHWIWNEGCPADIVPFEGRRLVLLGPPPYDRHWRAGRQFSGMPGELAVERTLPAAEVNAWLARLRSAPPPAG